MRVLCWKGPGRLVFRQSVLLRTALRMDWVTIRDVSLERVQRGFGLRYPRNFSFFGRKIPQAQAGKGRKMVFLGRVFRRNGGPGWPVSGLSVRTNPGPRSDKVKKIGDMAQERL